MGYGRLSACHKSRYQHGKVRASYLELAFSVIDYFQLSREDAEAIYREVVDAVDQWCEIAN